MTRFASLSLAAQAAVVTAMTMLTPVSAADTSELPNVTELQETELQEEVKNLATAEVIVLFASNAGTGIHECAAHMKALKQPPLSSYDSYACLSNKKLPLQLKTSATMATPDKGKLSLLLNEVKPRDKKTPKYNVDVQIDKADGSKYVSTNVKAPQGKYFFLAGQKYKNEGVDGVLVFAIRMQAP